jgi:hypothetical protein
MPERSDNQSRSDAAPRGARKPYSAPRLMRYGDVAHLTRTVGPPGKLKDNPSVAKTRTV